MFIYDSGDWHKGRQFANLSPNLKSYIGEHTPPKSPKTSFFTAKPKASLPDHLTPT